MQSKVWVPVAWVVTILLFILTSFGWLIMLIFTSMAGIPPVAPLEELILILFFLGWPLTMLLTVVAFVATIISRRRDNPRLLPLATGAPYVLWLVTIVPFLIWFLFFSGPTWRVDLRRPAFLLQHLLLQARLQLFQHLNRAADKKLSLL